MLGSKDTQGFHALITCMRPAFVPCHFLFFIEQRCSMKTGMCRLLTYRMQQGWLAQCLSTLHRQLRRLFAVVQCIVCSQLSPSLCITKHCQGVRLLMVRRRQSLTDQYDAAVQTVHQKQHGYQQLVAAAHQEGTAGLILDMQAALAKLHHDCKQVCLVPSNHLCVGRSVWRCGLGTNDYLLPGSGCTAWKLWHSAVCDINLEISGSQVSLLCLTTHSPL